MANQELFSAFSQNNVLVVLSSNNLYVPYASVFIQSLIDHADAENNILGRKQVNMDVCDYFSHTLLMKDPLAYVNSGVLVFDAEKYREE